MTPRELTGEGGDGPQLFRDAIGQGALRVFVGVATEGSFSRAADVLFLSQPWVSTQIRELESRVGLQLFERSTQSVELTASGAALLSHAEAVLAGIDAMSERVAASSPTRGTRLRIGAPTYTFGLPGRKDVFDHFSRTHPEVEIEIDNSPTATILQRLRDGDLDAAFVLEPIAVDELLSVPFAAVPSGIAVPTGHRLAASDHVRRTDLRGERIATWRREIHPGAFDLIYQSLVDAGAIPVPLAGIVIEGLASGAADRGLPFVRSFGQTLPAGYALRPLDPPIDVRFSLVARDEAWSENLRDFWQIVSGETD